MVKRYRKITARTLQHVLTWGDIAHKYKRWTKPDSNTYHLVQKEIRQIQHAKYEQSKALPKARAAS